MKKSSMLRVVAMMFVCTAVFSLNSIEIFASSVKRSDSFDIEKQADLYSYKKNPTVNPKKEILRQIRINKKEYKRSHKKKRRKKRGWRTAGLIALVILGTLVLMAGVFVLTAVIWYGNFSAISYIALFGGWAGALVLGFLLIRNIVRKNPRRPLPVEQYGRDRNTQ